MFFFWKTLTLNQKTLRSYKHKQRSNTQAQYTKISSMCIHYQWTDWERNQENNIIHNSIKKIKCLGINFMKELKNSVMKNLNH
jgi:hypothetical protein